MCRLRIREQGLIHPNSIRFSSRYSRPKRRGWGWAFPSASRSSRATVVAFGLRHPSTEARSFNLNCRSILPKSQWHERESAPLTGDNRCAAVRLNEARTPTVSKPILPFEENIGQRRRNQHQHNGEWIAELPLELRHVFEVHTVDRRD